MPLPERDFRRLLLTAPDELDTNAIEYLFHKVGIGYIQA